jgi:glycosyltransferase involved in cell wall biosynthesis
MTRQAPFRVSVIVPVYNVAPYLERCIDSICHQSYADLEIIIVDDGSTDGSSQICDRLAKSDDRISVIHQANGGLSAARNSGIESATGEFLTFVDSDDWIHPQFVETLLAIAIDKDCELVMCNFKRCKNRSVIEPSSSPAQVFTRDEAIPRMLRGEWISAWAKLYRRSLFDGFRFPVGRNNEDYAILLFIFERCNQIGYTPDALYFYFIRTGSITRSKLNDHSFDEFFNGQEVWHYCQDNYPQWEALALFNLTASIIKLTGECVTENKYPDRYDQMRGFVLSHKKQILHNPELPFKYHPFLWALIIRKKLHRKMMLKYYK